MKGSWKVQPIPGVSRAEGAAAAAHFVPLALVHFENLIFQTTPGNWHPRSKNPFKNSSVPTETSPVVSTAPRPEETREVVKELLLSRAGAPNISWGMGSWEERAPAGGMLLSAGFILNFLASFASRKSNSWAGMHEWVGKIPWNIPGGGNVLLHPWIHEAFHA